MTDIEKPFGVSLPFAWNQFALDQLIANDSSGLLGELYSANRSLVRTVPSTPEGFDGMVAVPQLGAVAAVNIRPLLEAYLRALALSLATGWKVCDATQATREQHCEFLGAFHLINQQPLAFAAVQLARRNFKKVRHDDLDGLRDYETFVDPLTVLVAIHQLISSDRNYQIPALHIFTPGLLYRAKTTGEYSDVTRIDVEPPSHDRPGLITLDWNWYNPNRARPNYNVGTMLVMP